MTSSEMVELSPTVSSIDFLLSGPALKVVTSGVNARKICDRRSEKMTKQLNPALIFILGAASGGFFTKLGENAYESHFISPDRSIATSMCRGPETLTVAVNEVGEEFLVTDIAAQYPISHIVSLKNDGSEVIDDYDISLSLFPENLGSENKSVFQLSSQEISTALEESRILDFIVFYESSASTHEFTTSLGHAASSISLKDFNPGDEIFVLFESRVPWNASVVLKGPGITYDASHDGDCGIFHDGSYGGVVRYRWVAEECEAQDYPDLSLSCSVNATIPKDFSSNGEVSLELRPKR